MTTGTNGYGGAHRLNPVADHAKSPRRTHYCYAMIDHNINYYEVLGIQANADLATIKRAFRKRALESHPDRGGSHAAMLVVNEAYAILANAEMRRNYDEARANRFNQRAQQMASADASQARAKAKEYPRDGQKFESWLDMLTEDFTNARYGNSGMVATVDNSATGCLFLILGFVLGGYLGYHIYVDGAVAEGTNGKMVFICAAMGGAVALWIHKAIGNALRQPKFSSLPPQTAGHPGHGGDEGFFGEAGGDLAGLCAQRSPGAWQSAELLSAGDIVFCNSCGVRNRLPTREAMLSARCGKCHATLLLPNHVSGNQPGNRR